MRIGLGETGALQRKKREDRHAILSVHSLGVMGCGASSAQLDGKTIGVDLQPGMEGCMMVGKGRSHDGLGMTGVVVSSPSRQQLACDVPVVEARANVCTGSRG